MSLLVYRCKLSPEGFLGLLVAPGCWGQSQAVCKLPKNPPGRLTLSGLQKLRTPRPKPLVWPLPAGKTCTMISFLILPFTPLFPANLTCNFSFLLAPWVILHPRF